MISEKVPENVKNQLKKHRQSHILAFWEQLDTRQKQDLLSQIQQLDFLGTDVRTADFVKNPTSVPIPDDFAPAPFYGINPSDAGQRHKYTQAGKLGKELISTGRVAAFVVAGGQGTRLGLDGPKGNFHISPVKNKTLFQIFAETIVAVSKKYKTICPWYIMTSPLNHSETIEIFRSNNYYGLKQSDVFIFQQGTLPNFSFDGKILLADKDRISVSPDGHGGSLKALYRSGALENMKSRGVEFVSYFQIDNPLVNIFDPLFLGLHVLDKAEMSSKAVIKSEPREKVGNFCLVDGKVTVIEYSDFNNLPDELAEKQNPDGSLVFGLASIAIHIINVNFIEKLSAAGFTLPLHKAVKKIPYLDGNGNLVEPTEPNGIKLESFVFDALSLAAKSIILQTLRSEEFSPVKNAAGSDSAETARRMMIARAADWLESAGIAVPKKPDGSADCVIEIAPGFALERDDVRARLKQIPKISPGDKIYLTNV